MNIEPKHIEQFHGHLKDILNMELASGNIICETWKGKMTEMSEDHIFVFLKYRFITQIRKDIPNIIYTDINDRHHWKAEYYDKINKLILACNFDRL